jgi:hypothetical protein
MAQQPVREECCNGYAPLLVSAPRGVVFRRRVRGDPLRRSRAGRGFLLCARPTSTGHYRSDITKPQHHARGLFFSLSQFLVLSRLRVASPPFARYLITPLIVSKTRAMFFCQPGGASEGAQTRGARGCQGCPWTFASSQRNLPPLAPCTMNANGAGARRKPTARSSGISSAAPSDPRALDAGQRAGKRKSPVAGAFPHIHLSLCTRGASHSPLPPV